MKNLTITLMMLGLFSCDNTEEWFETEVNDPPSITFTFLDNEINFIDDSIKYSSKVRQKYEVDITVKDEEFNIDFVYYDLVSGEGTVLSNGRFTDGILGTSNELQGKFNFSYRASGLGIHKMDIIVMDSFQATDSLTVRLTAFDNLKPIAKMDTKLVGILSDFEYILDASGSFDRDEKYGGNIELYEYTINSQVIERETDKLTHIFSKESVVVLGLRVKDNDGVWSEKFEEIKKID